MNIKTIILNERALTSLIAVTRQHFGNSREQDSNRVQLMNIRYIPYVQQGMLEVTGESFSKSRRLRYKTRILIEGIEFTDSEDEDATELIVPGNEKFYVKVDDKTSLKFKVNCGCLDFYYRFAPWNYQDNSLHGDPPPTYVKKTDRPPVNPTKTPGVCKHIISLKKDLEKNNVFKEIFN